MFFFACFFPRNPMKLSDGDYCLDDSRWLKVQKCGFHGRELTPSTVMRSIFQL